MPDPEDQEVEEEHQEVEPSPTPDHEPADPHQAPLDDDEDSKFLERSDRRREAAERRLSRRGD